MFYPESMTETQIVIPAKDLLPATRALAGLGAFHQVDAGSIAPEKAAAGENPWPERAAQYAGLEHAILALMRSLEIPEGEPPADASTEMIDETRIAPLLEKIKGRVDAMSGVLAERRKRLEHLRGYLRQLEPIAAVDIDLSALSDTRFLFTLLGIIPVENIDRLQTSLARIPFAFVTLHREGDKAVVWLAGGRNDAEILERAARSAYLNPLSLPDVRRGTPLEVIDSLNKAIERMTESVAEQKTEEAQLQAEHSDQLRTLLWRVRASRLIADAIARFGRLQYTYLLVGWIPSARLEELRRRLKAVSRDVVIDAFPVGRGDKTQSVPVKLGNPAILKPFQSLVTTYGRPSYPEVDPTLLIALTFPLLFGAMFGDVGHGLLLAFLGLVIQRKWIRPLRSMAGLGGLVIVCGLSATLFGFLYGSVFGLEDVLPALWLHPLTNILTILMVAVIAGVVILNVGFLLGILNAILSRDWGRLVFDRNSLAGFILYWSLIGLGASALHFLPVSPIVFAPSAAVTALAVMFSEALQHLAAGKRPLFEGSIVIYGVQAFFELFEALISFLSNTLSYIRVGAFAVAHGGLSSMVFLLATMFGGGGGVVYWVIIAIGTVFIVGFEGFIVGIQTMRLEYYEFFGKFFRGGGARYKPLTLTPEGNQE